VEANYSWSRTLQQLMTRYQAAVGATRLPLLGETWARAE
jgi:hypothetical protein